MKRLRISRSKRSALNRRGIGATLAARGSVRDPQEILALPQKVEHWSLTTLREKLVKIGAKVVSHGHTSRSK